MLLALLSNPRLAHVEIHHRSIDERFDHSDLELFQRERAAARKRSAAVTERLTVSSGTTDRTEM